jgi:cobyrinic acid a,c-diamide synthase
MKVAIRAHHAAHKPIVAECGGMLYLLDSLMDVDGHGAGMIGLLPGHATMLRRLANLGMQSVQLPEGELRGHTFHHSQIECAMEPLTQSKSARHHGTPEAVYRTARLTASYLHLYFPSNVEASARLFLP